MKFVIASFLALIVSTDAVSAPKVVSSFVNMNSQQCEGISALADACQKAIENRRILEEKLGSLDPSSDEYKKWVAFRPNMQASVDFACETVKTESSYEMAVAILNLNEAVTFPASNLDKGRLGRVEFSQAEIKDQTISISVAQVKMTVFGNFYCLSVTKSGGNVSKALETIASDIFSQK